MNISQRVSELLSEHNVPTEIFKGTQSHQNVGGVLVLNLCVWPDGDICEYQVS